MARYPLVIFAHPTVLAVCCAVVFGAESLPPGDIPKDAVPVPMALFNFDRDALGKPPEHFTLASDGEASGIHWGIARDPNAPSPPNVLVQIGAGKPGDNFALALLQNIAMDHGELAVRVKALTDQEDQAAGLVYHYKDPQNYDVIEANIREDSCSLYRVKRGKRKLIGTQQIIITPMVWHELRITFSKGFYTALVGNELVLGGKDKPGQSPGLVGLWTPARAQIAFDDFRVSKTETP